MCLALEIFRGAPVASTKNFWLTKTGIVILAASCGTAIFIALVVVPAITRATSFASENVSLTLGGVFLVITIGCYLGAYALNKKKPVE
jgi:ABC-type antimicrobial peptide transport system permease subunit